METNFDLSVAVERELFGQKEARPGFQNTVRNFSGSLDLIAEFVYPKLEELGLRNQFMSALAKIFDAPFRFHNWLYVTATPEQICRAVIACLPAVEADKRKPSDEGLSPEAVARLKTFLGERGTQ